jgi:hypothetical protein
MLKKGALLALFFLIVCSFSVAAGFAVKTTPVYNTILPGEQALFDVTITNTGNYEDTYRMFISDITWDVQTQPLSDFFGGMKIKPEESKTTRLIIRPELDKPYGAHRVTLSVKSQNAGVIKLSYLNVNLVSPKPQIRDYLAAVSRIVDIPSQIDPRKEFDIKVNLQNRNPKNISELIITLRSNLIKKKVVTSLEPLAKKSVTVPVKLDALTPPQKDLLRVALTVENSTLQPEIEEEFQIIGYSEITEEEAEPRKGFLSTTREITYFNDGNLEAQKLVQIRTNFFKKIFTSTQPEHFVISRENKQYLAWQLTLKPQESVTVTVTESYVPLFIISVIIIVALVLYYVLRSPLIIKKEAAVIGLREGGISELRVLLHIKNRTKKPFERLTVADRVPKIAEMEKELEVGTLKPTKVFQHRKEGTIIKWEIDGLEKYEERMLSYRLKSKLSILGGFNLPPALLKFYDEKGKERLTRSNKVRIEV